MKLDLINQTENSLLDFYKSSQDIQQAYLKAIKFKEKYFLIPLGDVHLLDEKSMIHLYESFSNNPLIRNIFKKEDVNKNNIATWFSNNIHNTENSIVFIISSSVINQLGYLLLNIFDSEDEKIAQIFDFYSVSFLSNIKNKKLYLDAIYALLNWARETIYIDNFFININNHDEENIIDYRSIGFSNEKKNQEYINKKIKNSSNSLLNVNQLFTQQQINSTLIYKTTSDPAKDFILTAGPSISAKEAVYAFDASMYGWNSQWSKYLSTFEAKFAKYIGVKYALSTSSCTGALQIALMSLDIGEGDEVIVPDQTWVATANAVRYVGAIPIFADIELDTWNLDSNSLESLITKKTKAVIPVHMYGHPARMSKIIKIARKYNLKIVEDAAPAIGAEWEGQRCGTFGDFAAFSFQGAKLLVTGEGGMLVTNNPSLFEKAKKIWDQGRNPSKAFWIDSEGVKFKMSNVQAAIGLGQIERVDELIAMKRRLFSWYEEFLSEVPNIRLNKEVEGAKSIYWMSSLILNEESSVKRDELIKELKSRNIDSRPVFPAISQYPIWPLKQQPKQNAKFVGENAINLPSGVCLNKEKIVYICKNISEILGKK